MNGDRRQSRPVSVATSARRRAVIRFLIWSTLLRVVPNAAATVAWQIARGLYPRNVGPRFVDGTPCGETKGLDAFIWEPTAGSHVISCTTAEGVSSCVTVRVKDRR